MENNQKDIAHTLDMTLDLYSAHGDRLSIIRFVGSAEEAMKKTGGINQNTLEKNIPAHKKMLALYGVDRSEEDIRMRIDFLLNNQTEDPHIKEVEYILDNAIDDYYLCFEELTKKMEHYLTRRGQIKPAP